MQVYILLVCIFLSQGVLFAADGVVKGADESREIRSSSSPDEDARESRESTGDSAVEYEGSAVELNPDVLAAHDRRHGAASGGGLSGVGSQEAVRYDWDDEEEVDESVSSRQSVRAHTASDRVSTRKKTISEHVINGIRYANRADEFVRDENVADARELYSQAGEQFLLAAQDAKNKTEKINLYIKAGYHYLLGHDADHADSCFKKARSHQRGNRSATHVKINLYGFTAMVDILKNRESHFLKYRQKMVELLGSEDKVAEWFMADAGQCRLVMKGWRPEERLAFMSTYQEFTKSKLRFE